MLVQGSRVPLECSYKKPYSFVHAKIDIIYDDSDHFTT